MLVDPNSSFTISVSAAATNVLQPRSSHSFLSMLCQGFCIFDFVFPTHVTSNTMAVSVTPSSHLFQGFPILLLLWIVGCRAFFGIQCSSIWIFYPANWIYWFYIPCAKVHVQLSLQWPSSYYVPLHDLRLVMRFKNNISTGEVSLMPNPQPGGPEYLFLSGRPCQ